MNWRLLAVLIKLRYLLMWAGMRARAGKAAIVAVGLLALPLLLSLSSAGGFGTAVVAIRSGKSEQVVQLVLSGIFVNAVLAIVTMGIGIDATFTDAELRRYPLRFHERVALRHILSLANPYWWLILALEFGLVVGIWNFGGLPFWNGALAALLLFLCSYLVACVVGIWIEQGMASGAGYAFAAAIGLGGFVPALVVAVLGERGAVWQKILPALDYTPPFAAAAAMTREGSARLHAFGTLAAWLAALSVLLMAFERRSPANRRQGRALVRSGIVRSTGCHSFSAAGWHRW